MRSTRRWTGCGPPGRDRDGPGRPAPGPGGGPGSRPVRPVLVLGGGHALPARGPRLLPRREEGHRADRVRDAHRPRRAPRRGPGRSPATPPTRPRSPPSSTVIEEFALEKMVMVGDRGMITTARIRALAERGGRRVDHRLRAPAIQKLRPTTGRCRCSLFDEQDLAEITHPDYPGERLIACRNPRPGRRAGPQTRRAARRHRGPPGHRHRRVQAAAGWPAPTRSASRRQGHQPATRWPSTSPSTSPTTFLDRAPRRRPIAAEAALDGIYVIRTSVPADRLDAGRRVAAYKNLSRVERDFRSLKADDLDLRPIHHHLEDRVRAHVFICMLAAYLTWHLRRPGTPDLHRRTPAHPGQPGRPRPPLPPGTGQSLHPPRERGPALQLPRPPRPTSPP